MILSVLQISAPISPGNSGGPVVNENGDVVGVATFTITEGQNINFAVPVKYVKNLLDNKSELVSLSSIAKRNKVWVWQLKRWNNIKNENIIRPGEPLRIYKVAS